MTSEALTLIFSRNSFYKRLHRLALAMLAVSWLIILVLGLIIFFLWKNPTPPIYFATDSVSRLIKLIPLSQPNMSTADVMAWTAEAVQAAYSYDYVNYGSELQASQKYFTTYGWTQFIRALTASNNLLAVKQRKMVVSASITGTPTILAQGILAGKYAWKFQMPVTVTYLMPPYDNSEDATFTNNLMLTVIVQRQSALQSYKGLGVVQMVAALTSGIAPTPLQEVSAVGGS